MARVLSTDPVLVVTDLEVTTKWFAAMFGCGVEQLQDRWALCKVDTVGFMLHERPDAPSASGLGPHGYVAYLRVEGVDDFHERARAAGEATVSAPVDQPWGRRELTLRTPDGHVLVLGER